MLLKHTPGPWRWWLNRGSKRVDLIATGLPAWRNEIVMDFVRWGMVGAAPRFRQASDSRPDNGIMHRIEKFGQVIVGREHHADWCQAVRHPDALLIQAAPELYEALDRLWEAVKRYDRIGFEGDYLLEAMSDARLALDHANGERLNQA